MNSGRADVASAWADTGRIENIAFGAHPVQKWGLGADFTRGMNSGAVALKVCKVLTLSVPE